MIGKKIPQDLDVYVSVFQDFMGDTPLHKAAKFGHLECVRLLTSHGPLLW